MALVPIPEAARHFDVSAPTIRNYIGRGLFPVYLPEGKRGGALVDIDEAAAALAEHGLPKPYAERGGFGPGAQVVRLAHDAAATLPPMSDEQAARAAALLRAGGAR
ncbi:hypothetical protein GCM10009846_10380 [Agrococcus versicolor]|uniref:DNA-binding protein n=1 Tax=Agrococcus versicolor TaxID=501482 RepID=A0ABN3ANV9_9MICO